MNYLTAKEVLRIHYVVIKQFGGRQGIHDLGLIESAIARPQAAFGDIEAYPDLFTKAAALLHSLAKNHGFIDGNKRTALVACGIFLKRNGYILNFTEKEVIWFILKVAEESLAEPDITIWLQQHSEEIQ